MEKVTLSNKQVTSLPQYCLPSKGGYDQIAGKTQQTRSTFQVEYRSDMRGMIKRTWMSYNGYYMVFNIGLLYDLVLHRCAMRPIHSLRAATPWLTNGVHANVSNISLVHFLYYIRKYEFIVWWYPCIYISVACNDLGITWQICTWIGINTMPTKVNWHVLFLMFFVGLRPCIYKSSSFNSQICRIMIKLRAAEFSKEEQVLKTSCHVGVITNQVKLKINSRCLSL